MSCAACSTRVEKAVAKIPGVESCSVSLLTNSMGVEGNVQPEQIIAAVESAGYGAAEKGHGAGSAGSAGSHPGAGGGSAMSEGEEMLRDRETPVLKQRLYASIGFLLVLMYFSMGHMMWNWPLEKYMSTIKNPTEARRRFLRSGVS